MVLLLPAPHNGSRQFVTLEKSISRRRWWWWGGVFLYIIDGGFPPDLAQTCTGSMLAVKVTTYVIKRFRFSGASFTILPPILPIVHSQWGFYPFIHLSVYPFGTYFGSLDSVFNGTCPAHCWYPSLLCLDDLWCVLKSTSIFHVLLLWS